MRRAQTVVGADSENEEDDERVERVEEGHHEEIAVDGEGEGEAEHDLHHRHARQKQAVQVPPHNQKHAHNAAARERNAAIRQRHALQLPHVRPQHHHLDVVVVLLDLDALEDRKRPFAVYLILLLVPVRVVLVARRRRIFIRVRKSKAIKGTATQAGVILVKRLSHSTPVELRVLSIDKALFEARQEGVDGVRIVQM